MGEGIREKGDAKAFGFAISRIPSPISLAAFALHQRQGIKIIPAFPIPATETPTAKKVTVRDTTTTR